MKNPVFPNLCIIVIVFLILEPFILSAQTITVSGDITADTTWSADTVKVTGDINVLNDVTLIINPGTYVEIRGYYEINVRGILLASGNPGDSIIFTINDSTDYSNYEDTTGKWKGIRLEDTDVLKDTINIKYCRISYATVGIYIGDYHYVAIDSSIIRNCSLNAIHIPKSNSRVSIKNCLINEIHGSAIKCENAYETVISQNEISLNYADLSGGAIYMDGCKGMQIDNNIIKDNYSGSEGGPITSYDGEDIRISSNQIYNNSGGFSSKGGAIKMDNTHNSIINNNILINNYTGYGGGVYMLKSDLVIHDNIICNNRAENDGGGLYIRDSEVMIINSTISKNLFMGVYCRNSKTAFYNSIIWGNQGSQILWDDNFSSPDFYFTTLQDGISGILHPHAAYNGIYENNLETDPLFQSPTLSAGIQPDALNANWNLQESSPCINTGTMEIPGFDITMVDAEGKDRIHNGQIDMGALEKRIGTIIIDDQLISFGSHNWIADTIIIANQDPPQMWIDYGVKITISPGAKIIIPENFNFFVLGTIRAQGTITDTIFFDVKDSLNYSDLGSTDGSWAGIQFRNDQSPPPDGNMNNLDSSVFEYCVFRHIKTKPAIILNHFSNLRIENTIIEKCAFNNNGGAIYCIYGDPVIINTIIRNNHAKSGAGIYLDHADAHIEGCIITNNTCGIDTAGGIFMESSSPTIINTRITENNWGGIIAKHSDPRFENCRIINNKGIGVLISDGSPVFINCLISNNQSNAISFVSAEYAILVNNTIVNNASSSLELKASRVSLFNNLIWNNGPISINTVTPGVTELSIHNCIIQGGIDPQYITQGFIKNYENVSFADPLFTDPLFTVGFDSNAYLSDWSVNSFSPAINNGTLLITDVDIPDYDLNGKARINADLIDIGAFEHQGNKLTIISQPTGGSFCEGEQVNLKVVANDTANYQWQKDGYDIPGANQPEYIIDPVTFNQEGNYRCIISNSYGPTVSEATTVFVKILPKVHILERESWVETGKEVIIKTYAEGSNIVYQWKKDGQLLSGEYLPEYHFVPTDSSYEGYYSCVVSNSCNSVESDPVPIFLAPQICMVTVDPLTGHNLIIWEKNSKAPVDTFNVYRESKAAGIYDLMGTVYHKNLSIFVDSTADPTVQAYIYKITCIDTTGYETDIDLCKPHKTIHLLVSTNPELNTTQLEWDKYYGFEY
ncbi:MAG: hypothetical protein AMS27_15760, partial [Bacteroides sp. SM23_62_1]